ncbi:MAG: LptA/OstA family protein [Treponemataceae bacterium]
MKKTISNIKNKFFLLIVLSTMISSFSFAEKINFSAEQMTGNAGKNSEYTLLTGNAFVTTTQMEIKAQSIEMSGKDFRFIIAKGSVTGRHIEGGFDFVSERITYDRQTKIALLEGNVSMDDQKNEVTAKAQFIEYNEANDVAIMQIGIELINKNSTCTAAFAIYRKKTKMLELSGNPQIVRDDDTFRAQEIIFNIDTEEIIMDGKVHGRVTDKQAPKKDPSAETAVDEQESEQDDANYSDEIEGIENEENIEMENTENESDTEESEQEIEDFTEESDNNADEEKPDFEDENIKREE